MYLHVEPGYEDLAEELKNALNQAQHGKGKERHANERPFRNQTMTVNIQKVGTGFSTGQAMKKAEELHGMVQRGEYDAAIQECYGAAVYLLATALYLREVQGCEGVEDVEDRPWLDDLVDWSQAPEWAEWAVQGENKIISFFENKPTFLTEVRGWGAFGRGEQYKTASILAHDWQTPLRRPRERGCDHCVNGWIFIPEADDYISCRYCNETGQVNE